MLRSGEWLHSTARTMTTYFLVSLQLLLLAIPNLCRFLLGSFGLVVKENLAYCAACYVSQFKSCISIDVFQYIFLGSIIIRFSSEMASMNKEGVASALDALSPAEVKNSEVIFHGLCNHSN